MGKGGVAIKAVDPAGQAAGTLVAGDVITHVNGKDVTAMAMPSIGALMKKAGAAVRFTLERRAAQIVPAVDTGDAVDAGTVRRGPDVEGADSSAAVDITGNHPATSYSAAATAAAHTAPMVEGARARVSIDVAMSEGTVMTPTSYDVVLIFDAPDQTIVSSQIMHECIAYACIAPIRCACKCARTSY